MSKAASSIEKYGLVWPTKDYSDPAKIEMYCIRQGGLWEAKGKKYGMGLLHHYLALRGYLWPKRWRHKWVDLIYKEILQNQMTILMGSASCGKTSTASEFCLLDYWCFPNNTAVLVSTTTRDKLESAVFGELKMLFKEARRMRPWLDGHLIDYKQIIATDSIEDGEVRDLRRGIIGKACYTGKQYVGLGVFAGIKQERVRFLADELQFMPATFLDCLPNMFSNPDVKVVGSGNPKHDPDDQLGIAAEPMDGWNSVSEIETTTVWNTRFYQSRCVNLIGTDSPNFDVADGEEEPYPRLIGRRFANKLAHDYGLNSPQYETQVKGRMKLALAHARVITRELCRQHKAHDMAVWLGEPLVKIKAVDPAYGGGDDCISINLEFGPSVDGNTILRIAGVKLIKIDLKDPRSPEDQIADTVKSDAEQEGVPPNNIFYDSFGKGTVGFAFARKFGADSPIPVDAGARPSKRPVRQDLYVDEPTGERRHKRCEEHYSKFITEMWFSVRYAIEAEQVRELPTDVMLEGCQRIYNVVAGNKIEVETKDDMKERTGKSPNKFDALAVGVEGARQRGFKIKRLGSGAKNALADRRGLMIKRLLKNSAELSASKELQSV